MVSPAIPLFIASGAIKAYGDIQQGNQQQRLNEKQADLLDMKADIALEQGQWQATQVSRKGMQLESEQRTGYAAMGVDVSKGTAAKLQDQTAALTREDVIQTNLNAAREAWGYTEQAKIERWKGDMAKYNGRLSAIGDILGTGGSIAGIA